ncbi:uncharacterized protein [Manis javanica]|uniref:uncharacterized protein isoform X2 n=1 Tax=Manis javanica TaxID=9974 RepID=UPI003C6CD1E7
MQAVSVSAAESSYEGKVHTWLRLSGCRAWWGLTGCLRRTCSTPCASRHRVPQPPPLGLCKPGTGTPGSGEAAAFQELHAGPGLPLLREAPGEGSVRLCPLHTQRRQEPLPLSLSS